MSSINVDLDFQDYAPQQTDDIPIHDSKILINIPSSSKVHSGPSSGQSAFGHLLQTSTNSKEDVIGQFVAHRLRKNQRDQRSKSSTSSTWGLSYLSQYFDVTTEDVLRRILWSALPVRKSGIDVDDLNDLDSIAPLADNDDNESQIPGAILNNDKIQSIIGRPYSYIERFIQSRPDLYGPFWISTTLIFAVAIFSNITSYLNYASKVEKVNLRALETNHVMNQTAEATSNQIVADLDDWHYSMSELNLTTSLVIFYVAVFPTFLWFIFWFRGCTKYYTLTETICAYGYSLSIFIPLSLLFIIQTLLFRYLVLAATAIMSGLVLMLSFIPIVQSDPNPNGSRIILALIPSFHFAFGYLVHRIMLQ